MNHIQIKHPEIIHAQEHYKSDEIQKDHEDTEEQKNESTRIQSWTWNEQSFSLFIDV